MMIKPVPTSRGRVTFIPETSARRSSTAIGHLPSSAFPEYRDYAERTRGVIPVKLRAS